MAVLSGTGSGIGTYILNLLEDEYPEIYRLAVNCEKYIHQFVGHMTFMTNEHA